VQERLPAAALIASPYDVEARYGTKRGSAWVGYNVHLTETCEDDQPPLITGVMTTPATTPDGVMGPLIQDDWAARHLLPRMHLLDGGSVDAELLVTAQTVHQVDVVGPPFGSYSHQRRAGQGDDLSAFVIDWEAQQARGPPGQTRIRWTPGRDVSGDPVGRMRCQAATWRAGPVRQACPRANHAPRPRTVRPQAHHEAIHAARQRPETVACTAHDARWAGLEGPHTQASRRWGLRPWRAIGHARTPGQPILTATALTLVRVAAWVEDTPRATTRRSVLATLAASALTECARACALTSGADPGGAPMSILRSTGLHAMFQAPRGSQTPSTRSPVRRFGVRPPSPVGG
jgi:transposase